MNRIFGPKIQSESDIIGLHESEIETTKRCLKCINAIPIYPHDLPSLDYDARTLNFSQMDHISCLNFVGMLVQMTRLNLNDSELVALRGIITKSGPVVVYAKMNH